MSTAPELFADESQFGLFHDFVKRMAAIRELFEECNLLLADSNGTEDAYANANL